MNTKLKNIVLGAFVSLGLTSTTYAASISPAFQTFGLLPGATFGGSGIPTDPTAFSVFNDGNGNKVTLGIAAT